MDMFEMRPRGRRRGRFDGDASIGEHDANPPTIWRICAQPVERRTSRQNADTAADSARLRSARHGESQSNPALDSHDDLSPALLRSQAVPPLIGRRMRRSMRARRVF
ncbi:hypothetical protein [Burkholderia sp. BDU5]|uniref:hypothetical protein n=1 Tax=Burkholderia sp. BDU5 TaxID=1385590 RepID=UPI0012E34FBF|nr:hypothetical protein [Burkholderia sp. BDU5]